MFTFIDTPESLLQAAKIWEKSKDLAIDLECENNLHHYGSYISLIQISDYEQNWVVDVLKLKEIKPLLHILKNKEIQKIFHDVGFDFRILHKEFDCRPKNIFDTQIAALLLGKENLGLGYLLEEYLGVKKERSFQMADWIRRPLTTEMLSYAIGDTNYLIKLRDFLKKELKKKGRLSWLKEELEFIEKTENTYKEQTALDVKGIKEFSPIQLGVFKKLFKLREELAKFVDKPVHFVINNKLLKDFSLNPPNWKTVRRVHPIVRQKCNEFTEAVKDGSKEPIVIKTVLRKKYTTKDKEKFENLYELQKKAAEKNSIRGHLIINKEQMNEIIHSSNFKCLREWQKELLKKVGLQEW